MNRYPFLRYIAQFAVAFLPFLSGPFSLFDRLGIQPDANGNVSIAGIGFLTGPKPVVEFNASVTATFVLLVIAILNEWGSSGLPLARLRSFRQDYLDAKYEREWKQQLPSGFRLNVMFLRRPFYFLWLIPVFEWTWSKGFEPPNHKDAGLFLTRWQGLAGMAARDEEGKSVFFDKPGTSRPRYGLLPWQVKKTAHLKGILSLPILRKVSTQPQRFRCVGVINIDALTPQAAEILRKNETALTEHFVEFGFLLADLSV